jgi:heptosyltransferase III
MTNKKLLIIHQGALGDVVTSFTSLLLLRRTYSQIDLVCRQSIGRVAEYLKVIDRSFSLEAAAFSTLYGDNSVDVNEGLINFLRSYSDIVIFSISNKLAENIKNAYGRRVFQIPSRPEPSEKIHVGQYLISRMVNLKLLEGRAENNFMDLYQDFRNSDFKEKNIFIHPGSGSHFKNWPLKYFLKLEKMLSDDGFESVLILGPAEDGMAEIILRHGLSSGHVLQLFDLVKLVNILKTGSAFIGNDSGVSHLAAFLGLPTLVIFGPTDHLRWRPMGRKVETVSCRFDCDPCFETSKRDCQSMDCLMGISPQQVRHKFNMFISLPVPV